MSGFPSIPSGQGNSGQISHLLLAEPERLTDALKARANLNVLIIF